VIKTFARLLGHLLERQVQEIAPIIADIRDGTQTKPKLPASIFSK